MPEHLSDRAESLQGPPRASEGRKGRRPLRKGWSPLAREPRALGTERRGASRRVAGRTNNARFEGQITGATGTSGWEEQALTATCRDSVEEIALARPSTPRDRLFARKRLLPQPATGWRDRQRRASGAAARRPAGWRRGSPRRRSCGSPRGWRPGRAAGHKVFSASEAWFTIK